jgi:outer membrane protein TolC
MARIWRHTIAAALLGCSSLGARAAGDPFADLVAEALRANPEVRAARSERQAALARVAPAGALEDPMLELGVLNLPAESRSFSQEDMTMKMIGLAQRFPSPGKRGLRQEVASREAEAAGYGYRETVNRVLRELKIASYDALAAAESERLAAASRDTLERLLRVVEARYAVGQGSQADVLKAQTQLAKMRDELLRLARERATARSELGRALGRPEPVDPPAAALMASAQVTLDPKRLGEDALRQRPQLLALRALIAKSERAVELARKEASPDFDVRFSYGQRNTAPTGMKREDMVSITIAFNLPIWGESKNEPRISEAHASRDQALAAVLAQQQEIAMRLHHQSAAVDQGLASLRLYDRDILPQARLTVEAASSAYRVGRVDFMTLLDAQMSVFSYEIARVAALAAVHKALVEIDFLTGRLALDAIGAADASHESTGARL